MLAVPSVWGQLRNPVNSIAFALPFGFGWWTHLLIYLGGLCFFVFSFSFVLLVEITPTRRRRWRKKRAAARRALWLARRGFISLTPTLLRYHLAVLHQHHSADHTYIRRALSKMASDSNQSWKCIQCNRMAKAHAVFRANCGQHWTKVAEMATPNYAGSRRTSKSPRRSRRQQQWQDSWEQWEDQWPLPSRKQAASPRTKGKGKGKLEQRSETTPGAPLPPVEEVWNPQLPPTVSLPSAASMSSTPTSEAVQLRQLLNSLKKNKTSFPQRCKL